MSTGSRERWMYQQRIEYEDREALRTAPYKQQLADEKCRQLERYPQERQRQLVVWTYPLNDTVPTLSGRNLYLHIDGKPLIWKDLKEIPVKVESYAIQDASLCIILNPSDGVDRSVLGVNQSPCSAKFVAYCVSGRLRITEVSVVSKWSTTTYHYRNDYITTVRLLDSSNDTTYEVKWCRQMSPQFGEIEMLADVPEVLS